MNNTFWLQNLKSAESETVTFGPKLVEQCQSIVKKNRKSNAQFTPTTPTRVNCRVSSAS